MSHDRYPPSDFVQWENQYHYHPPSIPIPKFLVPYPPGPKASSTHSPVQGNATAASPAFKLSATSISRILGLAFAFLAAPLLALHKMTKRAPSRTPGVDVSAGSPVKRAGAGTLGQTDLTEEQLIARGDRVQRRRGPPAAALDAVSLGPHGGTSSSPHNDGRTNCYPLPLPADPPGNCHCYYTDSSSSFLSTAAPPPPTATANFPLPRHFFRHKNNKSRGNRQTRPYMTKDSVPITAAQPSSTRSRGSSTSDSPRLGGPVPSHNPRARAFLRKMLSMHKPKQSSGHDIPMRGPGPEVVGLGGVGATATSRQYRKRSVTVPSSTVSPYPPPSSSSSPGPADPTSPSQRVRLTPSRSTLFTEITRVDSGYASSGGSGVVERSSSESSGTSGSSTAASSVDPVSVTGDSFKSGLAAAAQPLRDENQARRLKDWSIQADDYCHTIKTPPKCNASARPIAAYLDNNVLDISPKNSLEYPRGVGMVEFTNPFAREFDRATPGNTSSPSSIPITTPANTTFSPRSPSHSLPSSPPPAPPPPRSRTPQIHITQSDCFSSSTNSDSSSSSPASANYSYTGLSNCPRDRRNPRPVYDLGDFLATRRASALLVPPRRPDLLPADCYHSSSISHSHVVRRLDSATTSLSSSSASSSDYSSPLQLPGPGPRRQRSVSTSTVADSRCRNSGGGGGGEGYYRCINSPSRRLQVPLVELRMSADNAFSACGGGGGDDDGDGGGGVTTALSVPPWHKQRRNSQQQQQQKQRTRRASVRGVSPAAATRRLVPPPPPPSLLPIADPKS